MLKIITKLLFSMKLSFVKKKRLGSVDYTNIKKFNVNAAL